MLARKYSILTLLVGAFLVLGLQNIQACSCVNRQTCEFASGAKTAFIGTVFDTKEIVRKVSHREMPVGGDWETNVYEEKRQISRISIEENFFGSDGKTEIVIETEINSSCAFPLQKGVRYLIYANQAQNEENLMTHFCSGSKPAAIASSEILYLRDLEASGPTVQGRVSFGEFRNADLTSLAKYGVTTIRLTNESEKIDSQIGKDGSYKFVGVRPGKYSIHPVLRDSLTTEDEYNPDIAKELEIEVTDKINVPDRGCVAKNFVVQENGRIAGQIVDSKGAPVPGVTVYLIPITKNGKKIPQRDECYDNGLCHDSEEGGRFFFKGLKAGYYLVGVRRGDYVCNDCLDAKYLKAYYASVALEKNATPVTVKFGKLTEGINLKLAAIYKERTVKGKVTFRDGRSAPNVSVRYVARTPDLKENGPRFIKTDKAGNFSFTGYEQHSYLVGAFTDQREGNDSLTALAVIVTVSSGIPVKEVSLVLDQDGNAECIKCFDSEEFTKRRPKPNRTVKTRRKLH